MEISTFVSVIRKLYNTLKENNLTTTLVHNMMTYMDVKFIMLIRTMVMLKLI